MMPIRFNLLFVAIFVLSAGLSGCDCDGTTLTPCTCDPASEACCKVDGDCEAGFVCEDKCRCIEDTTCATQECSVGDDCLSLGACFGCEDGCCTDLQCDSDADCPPDGVNPRYCPDLADPETGCRICKYVRCTIDEECADPTFPLYQQCPAGQFPRCSLGTCICDRPCGGECLDGAYCCEATNTCDPLLVPCAGIECPDCEQVNPEPGGTLNNATCQWDGADCSCVPLPPLDPAFAGLHSAIDLGADGIPVLSGYYGAPYGDLLFGLASSAEAGATVAWTFVDGVPAGAACEGAAAGPRGGIAEPGDDVGWETDIVVDANGFARIAYHDRTNGALKYAAFDGATWAIHTVDDLGLTGRFSSIGLDANGQPVIAYMTLRDDALLSHLMVAWATTPTPSAAADWTFHSLDSLAVPCRPADCPAGQACLLDTGACAVTDDPANCGGGNGCGADQVCVTGACEDVMPSSSLQDVPPGVGVFASLAFYSDGSPAVVYFDSTNGDLKHVAYNGVDAFDPPQVLDSDGNVGADCSLFITPDDNLHVVYQDADLGYLYYWSSAGGPAELIDLGARDANGDPTDLAGAVGDPHWVGNFANLVVDGAGNARVVYQDGTSLDLVVAVRNGAGVWSVQILVRKFSDPAFDGTFGFFADQVLSAAGDVMQVSNFKHNLRTDPRSSDIDLRTHVVP